MVVTEAGQTVQGVTGRTFAYISHGETPLQTGGAGMRSLEDLERAFERGLNAWESGKVLTVAGRMGQKCVREVKRKTPVITAT